jgi:predicted DNA-binding protein
MVLQPDIRFKGKIMKQRYTTQTSLRLSTDLRESINTVCDAYKVNPSEYIRKVVARNVQNDLSQIRDGDMKIVFV